MKEMQNWKPLWKILPASLFLAVALGVNSPARDVGEGTGYVGLKNLPPDAWTDCPAAYRRAQEVPLMHYRSVWGPARWRLPDYFVINDANRAALRKDGVPESVLDKLAPLADRKIVTREELTAELGKLLTPAEMEQYRDRILMGSRGAERSGRRGDTTLIVPRGPFPVADNVMYDDDSWPRKPAKLIGDPVLTAEGNGTCRIQFELDRPDDVEVRVTDASGRVVRRLGAGVIGYETAPEPFLAGTLKQSIVWDGKNEQGKAVADGWRVEVGVGMKPVFEQFIGYDPAQLTPYLAGLQIDPQGRVYVWKHTMTREDPVMLRFNRDGSYDEMVYPSNPDHLKAMGKTLADVYERVEHVQGREIPIWERLIYTEITRWDQFSNIPFVIDPNGRASFVELLNKHSHPPFFPENVAHVFPVEDLDHFWMKPYHAYGMTGAWQILHNTAATTTDKDGYIYAATKRFEDHHALTGMMDKNQVGTIIKIDPVTRQGVNSFTWLGDQPLEKPRYYLGAPAERLNPRSVNPIYEKHFEVFIDQKDVKPLPQDTETSFVEIQSIDVDDNGNILVVDGLPRRIKMYAADGRWLGDVKGLTVNGRLRTFFDLAEVGHGPDAHYVISSFKDEPGTSYLIKVKDLTGTPSVIWTVPLDERSRYIAVDRNTQPNLVWVGNGGGPATFTRIEDLGSEAGEVRHIGGIRDGVFVDPWRMAASRTGKLFVYDHFTRSLVATDQDGRSWKSVELHPVNPVTEYSERYRVFMHVDLEARRGDVSMWSMAVDDETGQLWTSHRPGMQGVVTVYTKEHSRWPFQPIPSPGVVTYDFDLNRVQTGFEEGSMTPNFVAARTVPMPNPHAESYRDMNILYDASVQNQRWSTDTQGRLVGQLTTRDGKTGKLMDWIRLALEVGSGSLTVDSKGNIYVLDLVETDPYSKSDMLFGFPNERLYHRGQQNTANSYFFQRGDRYVTHQCELIDLVKFGPLGGVRHTSDEQWAHRGAGYIPASCGGCDIEVNGLACDGADRIITADSNHHRVKVLDTAGRLIGMFGVYGNAETVPGPDGDCDRLGFSSMYAVAAVGDTVYVSDRDLQRIAKVRLDYRERKTARLTEAEDKRPKRASAATRAPQMVKGGAEFNIDAPDQAVAGDWHWSGPEDLSAAVRLEKTEKALRLTVDVTDDLLYTEAPPWSPFDGDSVEWYLDVRPKERRNRSYEKGVLQIFIAPALGKGNDRIIFRQNGKQVSQIPGAVSISERTARGYRVTATIPFEGLAVNHDVPGDSLRFDVGLNDNDDGLGRTTQMMGIGSGNNWNNAQGFGEADFGR